MGESDLKEVFQRLNAIEKVLAKVEANTSYHISTMVDHEQRLRTLEAWQWKAIGFAGAIAFLVSVAVAFFGK